MYIFVPSFIIIVEVLGVVCALKLSRPWGRSYDPPKKPWAVGLLTVRQTIYVVPSTNETWFLRKNQFTYTLVSVIQAALLKVLIIFILLAEAIYQAMMMGDHRPNEPTGWLRMDITLIINHLLIVSIVVQTSEINYN